MMGWQRIGRACLRLWPQTQLGEPRPSRPTSVAHVYVLASRGNQRSSSMAESNTARRCGPHQGRGDCTGCCAMLDTHQRWANRGGGEGPTAALARALDARQMVDTSRWWLMRWPRNATSLLVRAGGLKDDEACKLFLALRVTAVRFGLELASQPKARRDAKEATDARAALRKRWVVMVGKLGLGYRPKRGAEMPDCVAVNI